VLNHVKSNVIIMGSSSLFQALQLTVMAVPHLLNVHVMLVLMVMTVVHAKKAFMGIPVKLAVIVCLEHVTMDLQALVSVSAPQGGPGRHVTNVEQAHTGYNVLLVLIVDSLVSVLMVAMGMVLVPARVALLANYVIVARRASLEALVRRVLIAVTTVNAMMVER
jgi:hypothetical protein